MMTWVSDRSGIASSGIVLIAWIASPTAIAVRTRTRTRLRAENSMIRSMTMSGMVSGVRSRRRGAGQRGAEPGLGVEEEVGRRHDLLSFLHSRADLAQIGEAHAGRHLARLEDARAGLDE